MPRMTAKLVEVKPVPETKPLSSVNFGSFAKDEAGNFYFAPGTRWFRTWAEPGPLYPEVTAVYDSAQVRVTVLPKGTQIVLTSGEGI